MRIETPVPCLRKATVVALTALALTGVAAVSDAAPAQAQAQLLETGSSLLYPLFNLWVLAYTRRNPRVQIITQSTGSGTGIAEAISGIAQIGASDAYMSNAQMKAHPQMLNVPLAVSAQMVSYNVPGLNRSHLKLSGPALAAMYAGRAAYWDDPAIARLNPGVELPHRQIVLVHRTDGSGDTFLFTQYLSFSTPEWMSSVGYGTSVSWPAVEGGVGAEGNPGMVNAVQGAPYSVAYIGISFEKITDADGLGEAALENRSGRFVLPSARTVEAAVRATAATTPADERVSLIFAPGAQSYPIINYEYAILKQSGSAPEAAAAIERFLDWAIEPEGGNAPRFMSAVGFVPLPHAIAALSRRQLDRIR